MIIALINISGSLFRRIQLLTLVQDSSMEQKTGIVSTTKVQTKIGRAKSLPRFLHPQYIHHDKSIRT